MSKVHLALSDPDRRKLFEKALKGKVPFYAWDSPDLMLVSAAVAADDIAVVPEGWATRNLGVLKLDSPPLFLIDLNEKRGFSPSAKLCSRAIALMDSGAAECLTSDARPEEIRGVIKFFLGQTLGRRRFSSTSLKPWILAGVAAVVFGLGFFAGKFSPISPPSMGSGQNTHRINLQSPTGIAVLDRTIWICDWYGQVITVYKMDRKLEALRSIPVNGFSPMGLCVNPAGLWSVGNDFKLRRHQLEGNFTVEEVFELPELNLSGLSWDGDNFWSCEWQTREVIRFALTPKPAVVERHPLAMDQPIGLVVDRNFVWVMDANKGKIHRYRHGGQTWEEDLVIPVDEFSFKANRAAGFGGDNNGLWVAAEKTGLLLRVDGGVR